LPVTYPDGRKTTKNFDLTVTEPVADVLSFYDRMLRVSSEPKTGNWFRDVTMGDDPSPYVVTHSDGYEYYCVSSRPFLDTVREGYICIVPRGETVEIAGYTWHAGGGGPGCPPCGE
jgi:hypothetical protein